MRLYADKPIANTNKSFAYSLQKSIPSLSTAGRTTSGNILQPRLQDIVNNSEQVKQLKAYQLMANDALSVNQKVFLKGNETGKGHNLPGGISIQNKNTLSSNLSWGSSPFMMRQSHLTTQNIVQRAVITVNADGLIGDNAQTVADITGASAGAFSEVKDDETIYIFAHGYHTLTRPLTEQDPTTNLEPMLMGGITAAKLCQMMIEEGWREEHTGAIDIRACMSGAESMLPSFAELFATELKKAGRSNLVTGYKHLSKTENDGSEVAMKPTVSKMVEVAKRFDPNNIQHQFFAMDVTQLFESRVTGLLERREKFNMFTDKPVFLIGSPPEGSGMSAEEWNIYSYYHALETKNGALINALNKDFSQREHQIHKTIGGKHDRQFDPADMHVPEQVQEEVNSSDDELFSRLNALKF